MWASMALRNVIGGFSRTRWLPALTMGSGLLIGLFLSYARGVVLREVKAPDTVFEKPPEVIRFVTFNVAHGRGLALYQGLVDDERIQSNLKELGEYLRRLDADVVGLQEIDQDCNWSGNINQLEVIAREAGYPHYRFGVNNRNGGDYRLFYGNAILSRHPIVSFENHPFGDAPVAEKGFLIADVNMGGECVTCVVTHLDPIRKSEREEQVRKIAEVVGDRDKPVVVMGDFNCELENESPMKTLCRELDLQIPGQEEKRRDTYWQLLNKTIDFVFASDGITYENYRVGEAKLSDHYAVIADLVLEKSEKEESSSPAVPTAEVGAGE